MDSILKLTQYSKASGCGCKIAPDRLEQILKNVKVSDQQFPNLLVGNKSNDDAAVYQIDKENAIISTTDFFTPIVDDCFQFGQIAAANAISDIYAMGGKPIMALAILGWPVDLINESYASEVLNGAISICNEAGIPLAGGHTIETKEPIFGLSVNGLIHPSKVKRNNEVKEGDLLFITKPLGSGIISAAMKREVLDEKYYKSYLKYATQLNSIGAVFGNLDYVHALTDITGFGLLGHLKEMLAGSNLGAIIYNAKIPLFNGVSDLVAKFVYPDMTTKNYNTIKNITSGLTGLEFLTLCDPQTNGGLLVSVDPKHEKEFIEVLKENGIQEEFCVAIGVVGERAGEIVIGVE